jgi:hypothetical protein
MWIWSRLFRTRHTLHARADLSLVCWTCSTRTAQPVLPFFWRVYTYNNTLTKFWNET